MVEPEIYDFLEWISGVADTLGLAVLPEVHDLRATHERLSGHGFWTYDFVLPGLLLHAFYTRSTSRLAEHLAQSPVRQVTTLDCHDGIPIRPDLDDTLQPFEMSDLAARVQSFGGNVNRILSKAHTTAGDIHQLNCTYLSALGGDEEQYVAARAIHLFARGVPQIYYVGLLGGANDHDAVGRTGEGRAINRHDYSLAEIGTALQRPVVRRVMDLIRLRHTHPAFGGVLRVEADDQSLGMVWVHPDGELRLGVDLAAGRATIVDDGRAESIAEW
jgi:sucrose phosphorylase